VEFVWKYIPETLYEWGVFTDLNGSRPLPHYMWLCPAFFGGVSTIDGFNRNSLLLYDSKYLSFFLYFNIFIYFEKVLSFITAHLPKIPGQNEWIESLHRKGLMVRILNWTTITGNPFFFLH